MLALQMVIYGYASLILLFLVLDSRANKRMLPEKSKWFRIILYTTLWLIFSEAVTMFVDGRPGAAMYWVVYLSNSVLFLFNVLPLSLWLIYLDECILITERERKIKRIVYAGLNLVVVALVVINFFTGVLFTVTSENRYVRGDAIYLIMAINYLLYFGYLPTLAKYRKFIRGRTFELILALGILPIVGAVIQMLYYGTPLIWPMMALVALAAHILVEREEIRKDGLTGLPTRVTFESRAQYKVDRLQPFSIIMIDLDHFKMINDAHGHEEGDEAIKIIANLLEKSIKQGDTAYRYGGDEFILLIESTLPDIAEKVIARLKTSLNKWNESNQKPYTLSFSAGAAVYDGKKGVSVYELFKVADEMMYRQKQHKH